MDALVFRTENKRHEWGDAVLVLRVDVRAMRQKKVCGMIVAQEQCGVEGRPVIHILE